METRVQIEDFIRKPSDTLFGSKSVYLLTENTDFLLVYMYPIFKLCVHKKVFFNEIDPGLPDRDVVLNRALDGRLIKHSPVACNASVQDAWRINSNSRWLNKNSSPISITTPFGLFLNTVTRRRFEKRGFVIGKGEEGLRREAGCRGMGEVWKDATEFRFVVN